ncbi:MAG: potassium channel family protein [Janthinobacterium lividum]
MIQSLAVILALVLLAVTLQDAFEVMLLPRRINRRFRFMRLYFRACWAAWGALARHVKHPPRREHMLSLFGPLSMLLLFALWAGTLISGFGLLEWALQGPNRSSLPEQAYMSGVTFFTLGYGDVVPHTGAARLMAVLEAGTGIGFIAVVIGYLPVLYQLFSRREAHVIQLDARAGSPPIAVTMLCRHADGGGMDKVDPLLREWEIWGSELLESHLSYPMLAYYRSQHDNQSWLAALAVMMDTCAMILVGMEAIPPFQARMTFSMTRQVLVEMAGSFLIEPTRHDNEDRLPPEVWRRMMAEFAEAGVAWTENPGTRDTLAALRATYEPLLNGLSHRLLLPLPGWMPEGKVVDHWARGHRGLIASRLMDGLTDRSDPKLVPAGRGGPLWRRLRRSLRED